MEGGDGQRAGSPARPDRRSGWRISGSLVGKGDREDRRGGHAWSASTWATATVRVRAGAPGPGQIGAAAWRWSSWRRRSGSSRATISGLDWTPTAQGQIVAGVSVPRSEHMAVCQTRGESVGAAVSRQACCVRRCHKAAELGRRRAPAGAAERPDHPVSAIIAAGRRPRRGARRATVGAAGRPGTQNLFQRRTGEGRRVLVRTPPRVVQQRGHTPLVGPRQRTSPKALGSGACRLAQGVRRGRSSPRGWSASPTWCMTSTVTLSATDRNSERARRGGRRLEQTPELPWLLI